MSTIGALRQGSIGAARIARGVLPISSVIVVVDSTAATERQIHEALADVTRDRAIIVIAHRLSSVMYADEILFLDEGCIVERCTRDDLVALDGLYAHLYRLNSASFDDLAAGEEQGSDADPSGT